MVSASNGGFFLPTVDSPLGVQAKNWPKRISSFRMVQVALQAAPYKSMRYLVHHTKLTILHPIHPPHPIHHLHHPTIHLRTSQHAGIELLLFLAKTRLTRWCDAKTRHGNCCKPRLCGVKCLGRTSLHLANHHHLDWKLENAHNEDKATRFTTVRPADGWTSSGSSRPAPIFLYTQNPSKSYALQRVTSSQFIMTCPMSTPYQHCMSKEHRAASCCAHLDTFGHHVAMELLQHASRLTRSATCT